MRFPVGRIQVNQLKSINNEFLALTFLYASLCLLVLYLTGTGNAGVYAGTALAAIIMSISRSTLKILSPIFVMLLYVNAVVSLNNALLRDYMIIPPIFGFSDGVFMQNIARAIEPFGVQYIVNRPTGISDNIHVTGLLNLFLVFYLAKVRSNILLLFAILVAFIGFNMQIILVMLIWLSLFFSTARFSFRYVVLVIVLSMLLFILADYFLLQGAYYTMIGETIGVGLMNEINHYVKAMDFNRLMMGIKSGSIDDISDAGAIPLTDFGILGIPIQYGLLGIFCMVSIFFLFHKKGDNDVSLFLLCNYISFIHYVPIVSFLGLVFMAWLASVFSSTLSSKHSSTTIPPTIPVRTVTA